MRLKTKLKNAKIKQSYIIYLREAIGLSIKTVHIKERIIAEFERFIKGRDFAIFNNAIAKRYKEYLNNYERSGKHLTKKTVLNKLTTIRDFYKWLIDQTGYKRRIHKSHIDFLKLDLGTMNSIRTSQQYQKIPDLEYVTKLANSIEINNDVDLRDKALLAFALLSGLRADSMTSVKIEDFDVEKLTVTLNPLKGSKTKFSKAFVVRLLVFDEKLLTPIIKWYSYLIKSKKYGPLDPLFPMTDMKNLPGTNTLSSFNVKPEFWKLPGSINKIFKDRSEKAGLPYYQPHLFRGLHSTLALGMARGTRELIAISRNLGHDSIKTTIGFYDYMDINTQLMILSKIDFNKRNIESTEDEISEMKEMMKEMMKDMKELKEANKKNIDSKKK